MKRTLITENEAILMNVVKDVTKQKCAFQELDPFQQSAVLERIDKKGINCKIFEKRGFDLLSQKFFVFQYTFHDKETYDVDLNKIEFDTFSDFFKYLSGDIYSESCYYGYHFSKEEIAQFSLKLEDINFDSFISYNIDSYSFNEIKEREKQDLLSKLKTLSALNEWYKKLGQVSSYKTLVSERRNFLKRFDLSDAGKIFFSFLIRKSGVNCKKALIDFFCRRGEYEGIKFDDILLNYGGAAAEEVVNRFVGTMSPSTQTRRKKEFSEKLQAIRKGPIYRIRSSGYSSDSGIYYVFDKFADQEGKLIARTTHYFATFDEMAEFLSGNLEGCDLFKAPVSLDKISKYSIYETTRLPASNEYSDYKIKKYFLDDQYHVDQVWFDNAKTVILKDTQTFKFFFDFARFLKNDLSNADLLMLNGAENLDQVPNLVLKGIKVRSLVAKKLGISQKSISSELLKSRSFASTNKNEVASIESFLSCRPEDEDHEVQISYISDVHLLHRIEAYKCQSQEDVEYVLRLIAKELSDSGTYFNLIDGDLASNYQLFDLFITLLFDRRNSKKFFFTLGNHEYWPFQGKSIDEIVEFYRNLLAKKEMFLVHNDLYYITNYYSYPDRKLHRIREEELANISPEKLREKTRDANLFIFGGTGFAGKNEHFNANRKIYFDAVSRDQEIDESARFYKLYRKVCSVFPDKNVIIFTHMPFEDWAGSAKRQDGFIYVSGHNHRNYFFDDGYQRIYADNQIGYRGKNVSWKRFGADVKNDWFADYKDGIYEITRKDYQMYYRGIGETLTFNRDLENLYLIKKEGSCMFLMKSPVGHLQILNGGQIRSAEGHSLEYFYEHLSDYAKSVKMYLSQYQAFQKEVSKEIKSIGGSGTIHGSIIDIDFYNHLYLNPLDGSITPYFAYSTTYKYVYRNIASLLKFKCPQLYSSFEKIIQEKTSKNALILTKSKTIPSEKTVFVSDTSMYKVSRVLRGLQFTTNHNLVRLWSEAFVSNISEETGRKIVLGIIDPSTMPKPVIEPKPKAAHKPMVIKPTLSPEEKKNKLLKKYQEKLRLATGGDVLCLTYRGAKEKTDYKCSICGHEWSMRPDHFKERFRFKCPNCGSKK